MRSPVRPVVQPIFAAVSAVNLSPGEAVFEFFLFPRRGRIALASSLIQGARTETGRGDLWPTAALTLSTVTCASHVLGAGVTTSFSLDRTERYS